MTITRDSGTAFCVRIRGHEFKSDMSVADGGQDAAPSPAEFLAGSLGACIAMMVQGYCDTHGYDGDVEVSLTIELADDPKRIDGIVMDVELPEGFPEEKHEVVRRVAEHCVIHGTLTNTPRMDIEFA